MRVFAAFCRRLPAGLPLRGSGLFGMAGFAGILLPPERPVAPGVYSHI